MALFQAYQVPYSFKYDFDVNGGAITVIPMGVMIPPGVIVNYGFLQVGTALASPGNAKISIGTSLTPLSFMDEVDFGDFSSGAILEGEDLIIAMIEPGNNAEMSVTITDAIITAGTFIYTAICTVHQE